MRRRTIIFLSEKTFDFNKLEMWTIENNEKININTRTKDFV
tara:strand:+ start:668 stop:790 length:123 start_codon:yes stop_codon:yes gene_type:complete